MMSTTDIAIALPHPGIIIAAVAHRYYIPALKRALRNTTMAAIRADLKALGVACPAKRGQALATLATVAMELCWISAASRDMDEVRASIAGLRAVGRL